jgi:hypothetical protein
MLGTAALVAVVVTATSTFTATPTASSSAPTITPTPTPAASPSPVFATLSANPTSLSFPFQAVGHASKAATVIVTNTAANVAVALDPPTVSRGFVVTSDNCPSILPARASCTIAVASAPTVKGKQLGQLHLNSDAKYGVRVIKLKGKGVAPKMRSQPKSLTFGAVAADAAGIPRSVTLINDSPAPITFTTAPAATPPFNVTANTCTTIAPNGGACTVSVEFAPHKHGKYRGILELHDDAANSPQHIKIFGTSK